MFDIELLLYNKTRRMRGVFCNSAPALRQRGKVLT